MFQLLRWKQSAGVSSTSRWGKLTVRHGIQAQYCEFGFGSGILCLLGTRIRKRGFPESQTHIFASLMTIFWVKSNLILCHIFSVPVRKLNNFKLR